MIKSAKDRILNDLKAHKKSYKFVVYKSFLETQKNGQTSMEDLIERFREFYKRREENGLRVETYDATSTITNIKESGLNSIQNYVESMPLDKLGTLKKVPKEGKEYVHMESELWNELEAEDIKDIYEDIEMNLEQYYKEKVGDRYERDEFDEKKISAPTCDRLLYRNQLRWSVFKYGITIPQDSHDQFLDEIELEKGESKDITLQFQGEDYEARLNNIGHEGKHDSIQIRYDSNRGLKHKLRDVFEKSFEYIKEKRDSSDSDSNKEYKLPEEEAEFIEIYETEEPRSFELRAANIKKGEGQESNIWWVNQGKTLEAERDEGVLWAPLETQSGSKMYHWETMDEVNKGDIILHYANGSLRYVSKVKEPAVEKEKPEKIRDTDDVWGRKGRLIKTEYHNLDPVINLDAFNSEVRELDIDKGPINREGRVNQGYLFYLNKEGLEIIQESQPETEWPEFAVFQDIIPPPPNLSTEDKIAHIKDYLTAHGFYYPEGMLENFYLSLKTKPFVLLAGISGTGKTKLVEHFAHALGCNYDNGRYQLISVRPDWNDSSDLLGYKNLEGEFVPGPMINILQQAQSNPNDIHIVCLDEMNLARVEYYFSEFLSKMETRHNHNGRILSAPLFTEEDFEKPEDKAEYAGLRIPDNLYIVGTVNMDETTHHFSKKVLDRANTIEFSQVELSQLNLTDSEDRSAPLERVDNGFLRPDFISMSDCPGEEKEFIQAQVVAPLAEINDILEKASLHVGYRVRDEIAFYMLYNKRHSLLEHGDREAFDFQLMQKILPRIQGSSQLIKNVIIDLFKLAADIEQFDYMQDNPREIVNQRKSDDPDDGYETMKYPRSAEKLAMMYERMEQDGFTSYWL